MTRSFASHGYPWFALNGGRDPAHAGFGERRGQRRLQLPRADYPNRKLVPEAAKLCGAHHRHLTICATMADSREPVCGPPGLMGQPLPPSQSHSPFLGRPSWWECCQLLGRSGGSAANFVAQGSERGDQYSWSRAGVMTATHSVLRKWQPDAMPRVDPKSLNSSKLQSSNRSRGGARNNRIPTPFATRSRFALRPFPNKTR